MKLIFFIFLPLFFLLLVINKCHSQVIPVEGLCGYPGKPYKSILSNEKTEYNENEEVSIYCLNPSIDMIQTKYCSRGTWIGTEPFCGKENERYNLMIF